jgi:hypothetical protein
MIVCHVLATLLLQLGDNFLAKQAVTVEYKSVIALILCGFFLLVIPAISLLLVGIVHYFRGTPEERETTPL